MMHGGHLPELLVSWTWDPLVVAGLGAGSWLYGRGVRRMWRHAGVGHGVRPWQVAAYAGGIAAVVLALLSPLDGLADALFAAHMSQHALLMLVAAPLLVLARPLAASMWALPPRWRERAAVLFRPRGAWRVLTAPLVVLVVHAVTIWVWHIPSMFVAALRDDTVHAVQHLTFFLTAALFWWAVVHGRYGRIGYGLSVLFVFATAVQSSILGALAAIAQRVWYPEQSEQAAAWGLTPLEDQQLAGIIMWVPSGAIFVVVGVALFAAWLGESERRTARREAA